MNPEWLTAENANAKAVELINTIHEQIGGRNREITTSDEGVARVALQSADERGAILRDWFESSIGLVFGDDKETWYLTEARVGGQFADIGVVTWTTWIGDVVTRVRNAILDGSFPETLTYGPPGREREYEVGPFIEYVVRNGNVDRCDFKFRGQLGPDILEIEEEISPDEPHYGLRSRIRTLDLEQNDRIRGPVSGIYILTGGPGTGKTTVALHRVPYLIDNHADPKVETPKDTPKVTELNTLVVVWEPHLGPYLKSCLDALGLYQIPDANVALIWDWIAAELRKQIPFGPGDYKKIDSDVTGVSEVKRSLNEELLGKFLDGDYPVAESLRSETKYLIDEYKSVLTDLANQFPEVLNDQLSEVIDDRQSNLSQRNIFGRITTLIGELGKPKYPPNVAANRIKHLEKMQSRTRGARIVGVLRAFYRSEIVAEWIEDSFDSERLEEFEKVVDQQAEARLLSDADRFLLLWLIDFPQTKDILKQPVEPLPRYAHIMIDEAQYYEPIVLRLLTRLCDIPRGTMTIVGDLEQRVTANGGLIEWESAGMSVPDENIHRLEINYRWSEPVFEFLEIFQETSAIEGTLVRPKRWFAKNGQPPEVHKFADRRLEIECAVDKISAFRNSVDGNLGTIAVIVPDCYEDDVKSDLVKPLNDFAIATAWAVGDQVRDSVHKVVVTRYNNIVGLEFNAVFVLGVDEILKSKEKESVQSLWVALSRAHQFLLVSRVGGDPIFDKTVFDKFRQ